MANRSIAVAPAWVGSTAYALNAIVYNDTSPTKIYKCTTAGTSAASGGPTGTGTGISDGSCVWDYVAYDAVYSSCNSAFSAETKDLVTNTRILYVDLYPMNDTTACTTGTGWTTSSSYYIHVRCPANYTPNGKFDTSKYYLTGTTTGLFAIGAAYTRLDYLQVKTDAAGVTNTLLINGIDYCQIRNGFFWNAQYRAAANISGAENKAWNCIFKAYDRNGLILSGTSPEFRNCTMEGYGTASYGATNTGASSALYVNCASLNRFSSSSGWTGSGTYHANCTNNASSNATVPGTNGQTSKQRADMYAAPDSNDYSAKSGTVAIVNNGTSSQSPPSDDIIGTSRPQGGTYDIGAWEYIESSSSLKVLDGLARNSVSAVNGLALASMKNLNGLA